MLIGPLARTVPSTVPGVGLPTEVLHLPLLSLGRTPVTLTVADKVTVAKGKFAGKGKIEAGDAIETGLKDETFTKIDEKKGVNARITTEGEGDSAKITQILVLQQKKKKDTQ